MSLPALAVDRLMASLGINDETDLLRLEEIAWARGVLVTDDRLDGAEARLVMVQSKGVLTVSTAIQDPNRRRFSIAHELGHFEMHRNIQEFSLCLNKDIREILHKDANNKIEQEANEFASELLMPERFFAPLCLREEPSLEFISSLANRFMTSLTATSLRYIKFCNEPVVIIQSQGNKIQWFQGSSDFDRLREDLGFFIEPHNTLNPDTLAAKLFHDSDYPRKKINVSASSWFTHGKYNKNASIRECSIPMPNYDAVLTLLWIDDEIEDDYYDTW